MKTRPQLRLIVQFALPVFGLALVGGLIPRRDSQSPQVSPPKAQAEAESVPLRAIPAPAAPAVAPPTAAEVVAHPSAPKPSENASATLETDEQKSLWAAFHAARLAIQPLTALEAAMPRNEGVRFFAANPGEQLTARFLDGAVRLGSGLPGSEWSATLSVRPTDDDLQTAARPEAVGPRVEYPHAGGMTEWYVNKSEGIEHGFTLSQRPESSPSGEVRVEMDLEGLVARAADSTPDGTALDFADPSTGQALLAYRDLKVWDAEGRELPARMKAVEGGLAILIADAGAAYPVTIDPLITTYDDQFVPGFGTGSSIDSFGSSVAISGDTALIGAYRDFTAAGSAAGSAYVFVRSGAAWFQQARLTADDGYETEEFGISVDLEEDTAVIGARGWGGHRGAGYVFTRTGTTWNQQAILTASDAFDGSEIGTAVSLSGDTVLLGAPTGYAPPTEEPRGSAYVFVRSGTNWSQQAKLIAPDGSDYDRFGFSVAIDENSALVGNNSLSLAGSAPGKAYVFNRDGTIWSLQEILMADDAAAGDFFGASVALSDETALVQAPGGSTDAGSAYVFTRTGIAWSQQQKLAPDDAPTGKFGAVAISGDTAVAGEYVFTRAGTIWSQQAKVAVSDPAAGADLTGGVALDGETLLIGAEGESLTANSAVVFTRSGTTWTQQARLATGYEGEAGDRFGQSVALSGNTAVVGAHLDDTAAGTDAGGVYVFARVPSRIFGVEWVQQAKLNASDAAAGDWFGAAVALDGGTALIGAPTSDPAGSSSGSAYVFHRTGEVWSQQAKLTAVDAAADDLFGWAVAVEGDTALVGAVFDNNTAGVDAGGAYVFTRSGTVWSPQQKLVPTDAAAGDWLGYSVALSGDTALVGAIFDDTAGGNDAGSVSVFTRAGTVWSPQTKLFAGDGAPGDRFGYSVALLGDKALVGAALDDTTAGVDAGSAYVFARTGVSWLQEAKLTANDAAPGDSFGNAVALANDLALVAAYRDDTADGVNAGSAYVFVREGGVWGVPSRLFAPAGAAGDELGHSVALSDERALVGGRLIGAESGSVFVFSVFPPGDIAVEQPAGEDLTSGADTVDFGNVPTSGTGTREFVIRNTGTALLSGLGIAITGEFASSFSVTIAPVSPVPPGGSTVFTVTCTPASIGSLTAELQITSNDFDETVFRVSLTGTGFFAETGGDDLLKLPYYYFGDLIADGLGGFDTVVFPPGIRPQDLELTDTSGPEFFIQVGANTLSLQNFERLQFADGTLISLETIGEVMTWGTYLSYGQTGSGPGPNSLLPSRVSLAVQPEFGPRSLESAITVDAGGGHALAVSAFGRVFAWGRNDRGQLGIGTTVDEGSSHEIDLSGALAGKRVIAVAAGENFSLALTDEGKVYAWGANDLGQLGNGTTTASLVPLRVSGLSGKTITQIDAGTEHALALASDGKVFAWGSNSQGQLGIGSVDSQVLVPTAVVDTGVLAGKSITAIAAGDLHSLALGADGHVYAWGLNIGQLGDGSQINRAAPVEVDRTGPLAGQTVSAIAAGHYHSLAATSAGDVVSWGFNGSLALGIPDNGIESLPVAVPLGGAHVTKLAAGFAHSVALTDEGKILSWGDNGFGQHGTGQAGDPSLPVEVEARGWLAGRVVRDIAAGNWQTIALVEAVYLEPDIEVRIGFGGSSLLNGGPAVVLPATPVGQSSGDLALGVLNNGRVFLGGFSVSLTGDHPEDFAFDDLLNNLAYLDFGEVLVRFQPQATGLRRATLVITSNDPNESPFLVNLEAQGTPDDCPECAVVTELEQTPYPSPFPKWESLIANLIGFSTSTNEVRTISYNFDSSFTYQHNNTIRINTVSSQFAQARTAAQNSGLIVKGHEFNGPNSWFVLWGANNFAISGYPAMEAALNQIHSQGKAIKQIVIKPGTQNYLILLEDGTVVSQGIPQATLDQLGNVLLIKRVSLSHDGNLAVVKTDGTVVVTGDNLSANQQAFIAMITADIAQQSFQADYLYFGPNKEMIFQARKTGAAYLRHMGPIREQTEVATAAGNLELIQHLSPNYKYQLYRSPDLVTWQKIGPEVMGDNTFKKFTTPMGPDRGIYRFTVTFAAP